MSTINSLLSLFLRPQWYIALLVFGITFGITYWLYYYTLQRFIYRKIKLIYKFIYQTKATKREEYFYKNVLPQKSIEDVREDVEQWAIQKRDEVETLQATERFRKEFLMNLAHELRTPVFTIQGYVDTLLNGAIDDPEVNRKFLTNANRGIDRLVQLLDDLGEISKLESGKIPIIQESFAIQDMVKDVFEELSLKAKNKNIQLSIKTGTERQLFVYADKPKIRQVLVNLIENAIKYGHENGNVIAGFYEVDGHHIYTEISDDGPGISEEHLPRVFERFYRADRSRSRDVGGTGLGLAIVKHIIEAHGQTISVRSTVNVGSSFGFTLEKGKE
jgi:two-component system phosphate regulon sensor histidine kinase PhoR